MDQTKAQVGPAFAKNLHLKPVFMKAAQELSAEEIEKWQQSFESAFEREMDAFQRMLPELLSTHKGQYVALSEGCIVDHDTDELALAERVARMPQDKFVLIKHVVT